MDRDEYDRKAVYFLALLGSEDSGGWLLGSARLILGAARPGFRFPAEKAFQFDLPPRLQEIPVHQRAEVSRLVTEAVQGVLIGGLLTPLGLVQAIAEYSRGRGLRLGFSIMKMRFVRALDGAGLPLPRARPRGTDLSERRREGGVLLPPPGPRHPGVLAA